jgi:hypothetical protein
MQKGRNTENTGNAGNTGKTNPVSPICVQIARFYTFKMRAVHTPNDNFACIRYSKPSFNFCGGQMRQHTTHHFIPIPTSPARHAALPKQSHSLLVKCVMHCQGLKCRPFSLPREFTSSIVTAAYIPLDANAAFALKELCNGISKQQTLTPEAAFIVAGDFNHSNLKSVLPKFRQRGSLYCCG